MGSKRNFPGTEAPKIEQLRRKGYGIVCTIDAYSFNRGEKHDNATILLFETGRAKIAKAASCISNIEAIMVSFESIERKEGCLG